jgi:hypothetical protein
VNDQSGQRKRFPKPSIFLAFPFSDREKWIRQCGPPLLNLYGCDVRVGEAYFAKDISGAVTDDIAKSSLVVAFLTKAQQLADGRWVPSQWVLQEVGFARGKGIPVVLIRENGVYYETGILGDIQVIDLDADQEAFVAFTHLRAAIRDLLFGGQSENRLAVCHLAKLGRKDHWNRQWWDVWVWINGSGKQLESIDEVCYEFPDSFLPKLEEGDRHGAFGDYIETDSAIVIKAKILSKSGKQKKQIVKHRVTTAGAGFTLVT